MFQIIKMHFLMHSISIKYETHNTNESQISKFRNYPLSQQAFICPISAFNGLGEEVIVWMIKTDSRGKFDCYLSKKSTK